MVALPNWLNAKLFGVRTLSSESGELPERPALRILGAGVTVVDNPTTNTTDLTIESSPAPAGDATGWDPVSAVATTDLDISAVIENADGVLVSTGDRVGLVFQNDRTENGIYVVGDGSLLERATDADEASDFRTGMTFAVKGGAMYKGTSFGLVAASPVTLGSTELRYVELQADVDVKRVGAAGNGTRNDAADITAAHVASDAVVYSRGSYVVDATVTYGTATTVHRFVPGSKLYVAAGRTVTLNGQIVAAPGARIFDGPGRVILGPEASFPYVFPQWFGVVGDGIANDTDILAAIFVPGTVDANAQVFYPPGDYLIGYTASTTIAAGSNGQALPQATINVASTTGFPSTAGGVTRYAYVTTDEGAQLVAFTGTTGSTLTGCTGGTGTMSTGGAVAPTLRLGTGNQSHRFARGASFQTQGPITITGRIDAANDQQIFDGSGPVRFSPPRVEGVFITWWGAVGDGVADEYAAISAACTAANDVIYPPGTFALNTSTIGSVTNVHHFQGGALLKRSAPGQSVTVHGFVDAPTGQQIVDVQDDAASTTIAAGSNGAVLPQATINVASTTGYFAGPGFAIIATSIGPQLVSYTSKTPTTLAGCSGGLGTMSTGGAVADATPEVEFPDMTEVHGGWFGAKTHQQSPGFNNHAAIMAAHNALPDGGRLNLGLNRSGTVFKTSTIAFTKNISMVLHGCSLETDGTNGHLITAARNLLIGGRSLKDSFLAPKAGYSAIKLLPRPFVLAGEQMFLATNIAMYAGARGVDTEGLTGFYGGQFLIENCFFSYQTDVSVWLAPSVFYSFIVETYFYQVEQAIYVKDNCELKCHHITFELINSSTHAGIEAIGAAHLMIESSTLLVRRPNTQPAVLLYPSVDNLDCVVWINDTKFSPEGLTDLRYGPHIRVYKAGTATQNQWSLKSLKVDGNKFYGPAPMALTSIQRTGGAGQVDATVDTPAGFGHGLQVGDRIVVEYVTTDGTLNGGPFTLTAVGAAGATQTLRWVDAGSDNVSPILGQGYIHNPDLAAIQFSSPCTHPIIEGNEFESFGYAVDDSTPITGPILGLSQNGIFRGNPQWGPLGTEARAFKRGGVGFVIIEPMAGDSQPWIGGKPRMTETLTIRNRMDDSETLTAWTGGAGAYGVTPSLGQTDPFGGTRAALLTRAGTTEIITGDYPSTTITEAIFDTIDATGSPLRGVLSFWAKAGSLARMTVAIFDGASSGLFDMAPCHVALDTAWQQYHIPFGINAGGGTRNLIVSPGENEREAGTCYVFGFQISDVECDYLPTSGGAAVESVAGMRLEKTILLAPATASRLLKTDASKRLVSHAPGNTKVVATDGSGDLVALAYASAATADAIVQRDASGGAAFDDLSSNSIANAGDAQTKRLKISGGGTPVFTGSPALASGQLGSTGTLTLETGSTDTEGVIIMTPGGTGIGAYAIIYLSYSAALPGNTPTAQLTLESGTGTWGEGGGTTSRSSASIFAGSTNSALILLAINADDTGNKTFTSGSTYRIHYKVTLK